MERNQSGVESIFDGWTVKIVSLIGSLEQFDLVNILRRIEVFSKTGLLVVKQAELWIEFYFRQGQLVCVGPMRANVTLVDRLVQANLLSPQVLPQVRQMIKPTETNETQIALALIQAGYLDREVLRTWAAQETTRILQAVFAWPTGEIYFDENCQTPADRLLIALSLSALLEKLPAAILAPHPASLVAPLTDEPTYVPPQMSPAAAVRPETRNEPAQMSPAAPAPFAPAMAEMHTSRVSIPAAPSMVHAAPPVEQSPAFAQSNTGRPGEGLLNAAQLLEDVPFHQAGAADFVDMAQLLDDVPPPAFAEARSSASLGVEINISASSQISILPPQPVRNPLPPARIDISFMTPDLVLAPVDLSSLRERNPQVQLTPHQWNLFSLVDGQVSLQDLCQMLMAPAEQVYMVAGELIAIGLVVPLNPVTGPLSDQVAPAMVPSGYYPAYPSQPQPMVSAPLALQAPWGSGPHFGGESSGMYAAQQSMPRSNVYQGQYQASAAYSAVGRYR